MDITRRNFLKILGIGGASLATGIGFFSRTGKALPLENSVVNKKTGYSLVKFANKRHFDEIDDILISVNGNYLFIKRGIPVVVPDIYLEVADHAVIQEYYGRKKLKKKYISKVVKIYPYQKIRPATYEEFIKQNARSLYQVNRV